MSTYRGGHVIEAKNHLDGEPTREDRTVARGIAIHAAGDAIDAVDSLIGTFRLLASGKGTEVVEGSVSAGGRLTLIPPQDAASAPSETYFLLEGALEYEAQGVRRILRPGDYIVATDIQDVHILEAASDVRFLYISSQPFFHEISDRIQELRRLAVEVELKDGYTADHCTRLQNLSYATGKLMSLPPFRLHLLESGSYLHDVGKVKVPVEILTKPAALTEDEWSVVRRHPSFGREMLAPTVLRDAGPIVEQHHERFDGSGYPFGLAGDDIEVEAYIVAVADSYDAMTTDRSYRRAMPRLEALAELDRGVGSLYPGEVVRAFHAAVRTVESDQL